MNSSIRSLWEEMLSGVEGATLISFDQLIELAVSLIYPASVQRKLAKISLAIKSRALGFAGRWIAVW